MTAEHVDRLNAPTAAIGLNDHGPGGSLQARRSRERRFGEGMWLRRILGRSGDR